jgi:mannose-1-phosphate guanylyltransferase
VLHIVIPAGGSGTRLWPLSRACHPKFLQPLSGTPASLLQTTVSRIAPVTMPEATYIVTGTAHAAAVARQLPFLPESNIVVEPSAKDSCGAIGLAAALIARRDPRALMGAFSADHIVRDEGRFVECVHTGVEAAQDGRMVVFGIVPTYPETGYGYVECAGEVGIGPVRRVTRFKEKPDASQAAEYVRSGRYYWNASMFLWRVDVFLGELRRQQPALHDGLVEIAASWDTPDRQRVTDRVWPLLPKFSVDVAVMEGAAAAGRVVAVPADFGWTDVGDFHALGEALTGGGDANAVIHGAGTGDAVMDASPKPPVLLEECERVVLAPHSGRVVAALGLHDVIIVDTPDVLLVCERSRAQEVKQLVNRLAAEGHDQYL